MRIRIAQPTQPGENRVALIPRDVTALRAAGHEIVLDPGAGERAMFADADYTAAGAIVSAEGGSDLAVTVEAVVPHDTRAVLGFFDPLGAPERLAELAGRGLTVIALETVPRTTRAQSMDALSSQTTIVGYQAVLEAAVKAPVMFPMLMTAAGTIRPASVLVLGVGVAGLQAIATSRRLGAVVSAYDIRPEAREQVESLGARFVGGPVSQAASGTGGYATEVTAETRQAQQEALAAAVAAADVVITTAQVPGRRAPILVTKEMVATMKPGAVIVDAAAATGGNCEETRPGEIVDVGGVSVMGPLHLASRSATHASAMLSRNVANLIGVLTDADGRLSIDFSDDIIDAVVVAHDGAVRGRAA